MMKVQVKTFISLTFFILLCTHSVAYLFSLSVDKHSQCFTKKRNATPNYVAAGLSSTKYRFTVTESLFAVTKNGESVKTGLENDEDSDSERDNDLTFESRSSKSHLTASVTSTTKGHSFGQYVDVGSQVDPVYATLIFIAKAFAVGLLTGICVVLLKSSIAWTSTLLYEDLANNLPKPAFYWPLVLCKQIIISNHSYINTTV